MGLPEEDSLPPTYPQHPLLPLDDTQVFNVDVSQAQNSLGSGPRSNPTQKNETQANLDIANDIIQDALPPTQANHETQASVFEDRTLHEDETGAVNFGHLSDLVRPSSPASQDGGFASAADGEWRSQFSHTPYKPDFLPPETPALPKNPFASKTGGAIPFDGTQLFGQTQLMTSAIKNHSPTSSRPSPNILHNSMSPNFIHTSPLKHRANVSSPTDIRTSSPTRLHEVPNTVIKNNGVHFAPDETPLQGKDTNMYMIPESPTLQRPRSSGSHQPMAHYETMQKSQERKATSDTAAGSASPDSDSDDAFQQIARKKRVERKRALAAEELDKIAFIKPKSAAARQQGRKRRRLSEDAPVLSHDRPDVVEDAVPEAIVAPVLRDSQKVSNGVDATPSLDESTKATPRDETEEQAAGQEHNKQSTAPPATAATDLIDEEMIPATSPMQASSASNNNDQPASEPELPTLREEDESDQAETRLETSSLPPRRNTRRQNRPTTRRRQPFISSSASSTGAIAREESDVVAKTPAPQAAATDPYAFEDNEDDETTPKAVPPLLTRSRSKKNPASTPQEQADEDAPTTVSSSGLSVLSRTPNPSSRTSPTENNPSVTKSVETLSGFSPMPSRNLRKRPALSKPGSESPQPLKFMRVSTRLDSDSTDDPRQSPSISALESNLARSKSRLQWPATIQAVSRSDNELFAGMNFAISISRQGKGDREEETRKDLEAKIADAGGVILQDGFNALFGASSVMSTAGPDPQRGTDQLKLLDAASDTGFTALLADGHSRRAKYMQALALGLPCLAYQWVDRCIKKCAIVDWQPYLLCAGVSDVLGNTLRSRCLPPYSAAEVKLADVVSSRARLLDGQRLLAVIDPKKVRGQTKRQYIFLTEAMAPTMTRVSTVQQAQEAIRGAGEDTFDWLYVHGSSGTADAVLKGAEGPGPPAKRKRTKQGKKGGGGKTAAAAGKSVVANVRILHDELVIQSLILGRMVEPDEEDMFDKR